MLIQLATCLFTLTLVLTMRGISFSLLYVIENAAQEKISNLFDSIEEEIGIDNFKVLFPAIVQIEIRNSIIFLQ